MESSTGLVHLLIDSQFGEILAVKRTSLPGTVLANDNGVLLCSSGHLVSVHRLANRYTYQMASITLSIFIFWINQIIEP